MLLESWRCPEYKDALSMSTVRLLLGTAWIASVALAYFLGQSGSPPSPMPAPPSVPTAIAASHVPAAGEESASGVDEARVSPQSGVAAGNGSKDIPLMINRVRSALANRNNGMSLTGLLRALAPLAELEESELHETLAQVETTVPEEQKGIFYSLLLGQWAETDPSAALAYAEKVSKKDGDPFESGAKMAVIGTWAKHDPDAAWRWFLNQNGEAGDTASRRAMLSSIFGGFAARDLSGAFARLNTLDEQDRSQALGGIVNASRDERLRDQLLERSESLSPELRRQLQVDVVRSWASSDGNAAMQWVRSRPADEQGPVRTAVGNALMNTDPERSAAFLLEGASEKDRGKVVDSVVGQWAQRDPLRAGEWLNKQAQGPELDNARRTFASAVTQRDPAAAMDWAKSISSEDQRANSVQQVYVAWRKKDPAAADAALNASGINAERLEKIREAGQGK
jgi:hypothetical protein